VENEVVKDGKEVVGCRQAVKMTLSEESARDRQKCPTAAQVQEYTAYVVGYGE